MYRQVGRNNMFIYLLDNLMKGQIDSKLDRKIDRQIVRQIDGWTNRQVDGQINLYLKRLRIVNLYFQPLLHLHLG